MRAKSLLLLTLALGCGLVASIGITQVMARRDADPADPGEKQSILVAKKDIPMGEPLSAELVSVDSRPAAYVPAGALANVADLEGRRARTLIPANTPITDALLLGKGAGDQLASSGIPLGKRLATVKVEPQSAAGNLIRPGDCVDMLVHVKGDPVRGLAKTQARTILQNVRVFAVNDMWEISSTTGDKSLNAKTITLIVSPEEAELVTLAAALGDVRLVLRSPEDKEIKSLLGHDIQELLGLPSFAGGKGREKPDLSDVLKELVAPKPAPPPSAVAAAPAEEPKTFTVRILAGSQLTDVVLEAPTNAKESNQSGQFDVWKVNSPKSVSPAASHARPPMMPPVVGPPVDQPGAEPPQAADHKAHQGQKTGSKTDKTEKKGD